MKIQQKKRPSTAKETTKKDRGNLLDYFDPQITNQVYGGSQKKKIIQDDSSGTKTPMISLVCGTIRINQTMTNTLKDECEKEFGDTWFLRKYNEKTRSRIVT